MKQMSFYLIIIYVLLSACVGTSAQTLTFDFQDTPLADALTAIRDSQQDYTFHFIHNDLEGLVNYTLMMQPMIVGAMVKQTDGRVRISFRAKYDFDVNQFAHKYFGGGGHTQASGATSSYDFDTTLQVLEENMLKELSSHLKNKQSK